MKPVRLVILSCILFGLIHPCNARPVYTKKDTVLAREYKDYADSMMKIRAYDSAALYYNKSAEIYREIKHWNYLCFAEIWESYAYEDMGDYEKAIDNLNNAIAYFNKHLPPFNAESFRCSTNKSRVYYMMNDFIKSQEILRDALKLFRDNPEYEIPENQRHLAKAIFQYGGDCLQMGNIDSAKIMFTRAYEIAKENYPENSSFIIDCYNNLGIIYAYHQDYESAISYTLKGLYARESKYGFAHQMTAWSYANLGILYLDLNQFDKSLEYFNKALEARKQCLPPDHIDIGYSYSNIGNVYNETGDYEEALKYHQLALDIFINKFGEVDAQVSGVYNNIADAYNKQHEYRKALHYFIKALSIANEVQQGIFTPYDVLFKYNIADTYLKLNDPDSALYYNTLALDANFSRTKEHNNPDEILDQYVAMNTLEQKAILHLMKFRETNSQEDVQMALNAYQKYYDLFDYLRNSTTHQESKLILTQMNSSLTNGIINTAYLLHTIEPDSCSTDMVCRLIEKNKAAVLEEMISKTGSRFAQNIPDTLLNRWNTLSGNIFTLNTQRMLTAQKGSKEDLKKTDDKLFELQKELNELNEYISANYTSSSGMTFIQNSENAIRPEKDDPGYAVLSYYVSDSSLFIHVADYQKSTLRVIPVDSMLEESVSLYVKSIKKSRINEFGQRSAALYRLLIEPVEDIIKDKSKLIIIPDKFLYYLPFESLCSSYSETDQPDYLIKKYDISYHYSIGLYNQSLKKYKEKETSPVSFAGFAPVFKSGNDYSMIDKQTYASLLDTTFENSDEIMRSVSIDGETYNELPYSEKEVSTIAGMFSEQGFTAKEYLYANASEKAFKKDAQGFRYVHLASHGIMNENHPELSGIIFSQQNTDNDSSEFDGKVTDNTDGILFAGEMYTLHLNTDLLVLSACETGMGKVINGEGIMSMTRGFIYSGTPNILFSLWKIDDKNACNLMIDFYRYVLDGNSYSEALRQAKLDFMEEEETSFPKYWSGFTLVGVN